MPVDATPASEARSTVTRRVGLVKIRLQGLLVVLLMASGLFIVLKLGEEVRMAQAPSEEAVKLASSFERKHTLAGRDSRYMVWSPDSRTLLTGGQEGLAFWNANTGQLITSTTPIADPISGVQWSPDGSLLAVSTITNSIYLLDTGTYQVARSLNIPQLGGIPSVSKSTGRPMVCCRYIIKPLGWLPDGHSVVFSSHMWAFPLPRFRNDNDFGNDAGYWAIQVWDSATGKLSRNMKMSDIGGNTYVEGVTLSPDGNTLAAVIITNPTTSTDASKTLKLWDAKTGVLSHTISNIMLDRAPMYEGQILIWSPNGSKFAYRVGPVVRIMDVATGKVERSLPDVLPATYTPLPTLTPANTLPPPPSPVVTIYRPVQTVAGQYVPPLPKPTGPPPTFTPTNTVSPTPTWTPSPTSTPDVDVYSGIVSLAWSPDGHKMATYDYGATRIWNADTGKLEHIMSNGQEVDQHDRVIWSPNGRLVMTVQYMVEGITLWDAATGQPVGKLPKHKYMSDLEWSPNGHAFALPNYDYEPRSSNSGGIEIWGIRDDMLRTTPSAP